MSVRKMAEVWEHSHHAGTHLLMLLAVADFADDDGRAYLINRSNRREITTCNMQRPECFGRAEWSECCVVQAPIAFARGPPSQSFSGVFFWHRPRRSR